MKGIEYISDRKELESQNKFKRSSDMKYKKPGRLDGEETQF